MHTMFWLEYLGKTPLERPRREWEDNIRMDLREVLWEGVNWIHLSQGTDQWRDFVNAVMNVRFQ